MKNAKVCRTRHQPPRDMPECTSLKYSCIVLCMCVCYCCIIHDTRKTAKNFKMANLQHVFAVFIILFVCLRPQHPLTSSAPRAPSLSLLCAASRCLVGIPFQTLNFYTPPMRSRRGRSTSWDRSSNNVPLFLRILSFNCLLRHSCRSANKMRRSCSLLPTNCLPSNPKWQQTSTNSCSCCCCVTASICNVLASYEALRVNWLFQYHKWWGTQI